MILTLGTTPAVQRTMVFKHFALGEVNRSVHVHDSAAGKAGNVARVAKALGEDAIALGFQGGDSGMFYTHAMQSSGVTTDFIEVKLPTRTCITLIDEAAGTTTELVEEASPVDPSQVEALFGLFQKYIAGASVLILSGTLAPGVPENLYARCLSVANEHRVATIVDAKGEALRLALAQRPTFIKPNRSEVQATIHSKIETERDLIHAMKELVLQGAQHVVVTNGPGQTIYTDGNETTTFTTPKIKAINPIGSGDSFAAGLAVGLTRKNTPIECVRLGIACGVANAMTLYAAHVNPADAEAMLPQIQSNEK